MCYCLLRFSSSHIYISQVFIWKLWKQELTSVCCPFEVQIPYSQDICFWVFTSFYHKLSHSLTQLLYSYSLLKVLFIIILYRGLFRVAGLTLPPWNVGHLASQLLPWRCHTTENREWNHYREFLSINIWDCRITHSHALKKISLHCYGTVV